MFKEVDIPKRLIPGTIALGAFTFTMDALPGTPQIQNIIPTTFFDTTTWAAPILGIVGSVFILITGLAYLEWRRRKAAAAGEGYGEGHINEPEPVPEERLPNALLALSPLVAVFVLNRVFTALIPRFYGDEHELTLAGASDPVVTDVTKLVAIWSVTGALLVGILLTVALSFKLIRKRFAEGTKAAVSGALLASMNTASEYGFGGVIAGLSGFIVISDALRAIPNVLVNEAITVSVLAGVTGSASGGMSIALAAMSDTFIDAANAANVPLEVLHRVASMASGGMDTLPHNGAVITLLAVTGLTHREAYKDVFAITIVKTLAVFLIIGVYYLTGLY